MEGHFVTFEDDDFQKGSHEDCREPQAAFDRRRHRATNSNAQTSLHRNRIVAKQKHL